MFLVKYSCTLFKKKRLKSWHVLRDDIYPLCHAYRHMDDKLFTHPSSLLIGPFQTRDKTFIFQFSHFATLIGPILDPPTHNRPFADKRDKVGMDGVPKTLRHHEAIRVSAPNELFAKHRSHNLIEEASNIRYNF